MVELCKNLEFNLVEMRNTKINSKYIRCAISIVKIEAIISKD